MKSGTKGGPVITRAKRSTTDFRIELSGWTFLLEGSNLRMFFRDEEQVLLPLSPRIGNKRPRLGPWHRVGSDDHFEAAADGIGTAHIAVREGHLCFWLETTEQQFDTVTYFPGTTFNGSHWQSYMSDGWDRLWDKDIDQQVGVSSAYRDVTNVFGAEEGGQKDPRDTPPTYVWNMPPRAFSLQTEGGFVGFSIPGALPLGIARFTMRNRKFSLNFDTLRPSCTAGVMPVVYIVPGLEGAYDVLDEHRVISDRLGLTIQKSASHPNWWAKPCYKPSLEYIRAWQELERGVAWKPTTAGPKMQLSKEEGQALRDRRMQVITADNLRSWTYRVQDSLQVDEMNIALEQGIFRIYGDYTPVPTLGGVDGFRALVKEFRKRRIHVSFYIHPFMVNTSIDYFQNYPEALCKPIDKKTETIYNTEHLYDAAPKLGLIDWTHPRGRQYLLRQVEFILSSKRGNLDCDWLRSNHWRAPDPRFYRFHDPDWGIGDMMSMKVQKLIYEKAKSVKQHCCVSKASFAEPYMQPYADLDMLCEDHTPWTDSWYQRGEIATRLLRDVLFTTDPWQVSVTKSTEYYTAMAAWCTNEVPDVEHVIHPYGIFLKLRPRDYRRRLAGVKVQENAPLNLTDRIRVQRPERLRDEPIIWRKRTQGPLAGWYAALALSRRTFVTYSSSEARIASSQTRHVSFPLPPHARVKAIEVVLHTGTIQPAVATVHDHVDGRRIEMKVEDSGGKPLYYRVRYSFSK